MTESVSHPSGIIREFYRHEGAITERLVGDYVYRAVSQRAFPDLEGRAIHQDGHQAMALAILDLNEQLARKEEAEANEMPPLLMVGYHVMVPREVGAVRCQRGAYGTVTEGPGKAQARIEAWVDELDAHAKTRSPQMRAQPQPEQLDHMGFPRTWVIVWWEGFQEDTDLYEIESGRMHLEDNGYHVSSVSLEYDPAMA